MLSQDPKRQYSDQYINFGFIELKKKESVPECVVCLKTLSNESMERSLLQRRHQTNHPEKKDRDPNYFKRFGEIEKKQRLDNTRKQYQLSFFFLNSLNFINVKKANKRNIITINQKKITILSLQLINLSKVSFLDSDILLYKCC